MRRSVVGEPLSGVTRLLAADCYSPRPWVRYSTAITSAQGFKAKTAALAMRLYRFRQMKVKVGIAGQDDPARLRAIRRWAGAKMDIQPLAGDDFQSLMTLLPSIIRDPQGRLRVKGGSPTTGALQVSSASLTDPSTGDFDLELPSGAVESVEVLSNPFAAEYGPKSGPGSTPSWVSALASRLARSTIRA